MRENIQGRGILTLRFLGSGPVVAAILLGLVLSIVWAAQSPIADPYYTANTEWNGTSELVREGFIPLSVDLVRSLSNPSLLMVIAPTRQFTQSEANSIRDYVERGGLLVLADNFGSGNGLLKLLNVSISFDNKTLVDTLFYYKQPIFPLAIHMPSSEFLNGTNELVLNSPVTLNVTSEDNVRILASSSPFSFIDSNQNGEKDPGEPSGPFPVLAELRLGQGGVLLFTSPASFTNSMISLSDNMVLIRNSIKAGTAPGRTAPLLDETHLEPSQFRSTRLFAEQFVSSVASGDMSGSAKLALTSLALVVIVARYGYLRPSIEKMNKDEVLEGSSDVDSVMRLHPSWRRAELVYVQREVEAAMRWRLHERE
jgi:hypothetical protein